MSDMWPEQPAPKHPWEEYVGNYRKVFYDIKLRTTGAIITHCWPNADTFHTGFGIIYEGSIVEAIKVSDVQ